MATWLLTGDGRFVNVDDAKEVVVVEITDGYRVEVLWKDGEPEEVGNLFVPYKPAFRPTDAVQAAIAAIAEAIDNGRVINLSKIGRLITEKQAAATL